MNNAITCEGGAGLTDLQPTPSLVGPRLLRSLTPRNLLSFGPETQPLELKCLNVLIGPNGSGKSNLLEVIALLRSTADRWHTVILKGGGLAEWIWKGQPHHAASVDVVVSPPIGKHQGESSGLLASLPVDLAIPLPIGEQALRHVFKFGASNQSLFIDSEYVVNVLPDDPDSANVQSFYSFDGVAASLAIKGNNGHMIAHGMMDWERSILAQRRDPEQYPEITYLADVYDRIRIYQDWSFGRNTIFRRPQQADMRSDRLEEDFSNLGLFLNHLRRHPRAKNAVLVGLKDVYDGLTDFDVSIEGGTVQVFFTEGDFTIPATRLSDGSLRYLCLLAILCDPNPPPLIAIEEPELGLHPDLLPKLADRLVDASTRCQLIVTTHSDVLVDALSEHPECVVVCEKHAGVTSFTRLDSTDLAPWLEKYRLGQLWTRGQLGGTRW